MTDHALDSARSRVLRPDIQGLRAVAVVAVILDHAIGWPIGGFVGVDVFFVISGFLITGLLLRDIERTGRVSFRDFYGKRIRRILPAALLVLVVVTAAAFVVFNVTRAWQTVWDAVYSLVFVVNWHFAVQGTDYFHASDAVSPLQHFWSLSVEEQFYLVWPGLLLLLTFLLPAALRKNRARRMRAVRLTVAAAAMIIVAVSFGWAMLQTASDPTVAYFSTLTRAWELGVGALLATAVPLLRRLPAVLRGLLGWAGLAGVVASFFLVDGGATPFPGPGAALPVAATAVLIAGGVGGGRQGHLSPITNPVTVFLGDLSYSLYLWHFPVIVFFAVLLPTPGTSTTVIVLATIAALAVVSYFLVEQPLHRSPLLQSFRGVPLEPVAAWGAGDAAAGDSEGEAGGSPASAGAPVRAPETRRTGTRYGGGGAAAGRAGGSSATRPVPSSSPGRAPRTPGASGASGASGALGASGASGESDAGGSATGSNSRYARGAATTRPAGWTPGSRYSPMSAQRLRSGSPRPAFAAQTPAPRPHPETPAPTPHD